MHYLLRYMYPPNSVPCERIQHVKSQPAIPAIIIIIIIVRCDVFTQIVAFLINPFVVGFPRILPGVLLYFVVLLARIFVVVVIFFRYLFFNLSYFVTTLQNITNYPGLICVHLFTETAIRRFLNCTFIVPH